MSDNADVRARAAALSTAKANELNWPWDAGALTLKRPRLGGLGGVWRVSSYYAAENVTATIIVNLRTGHVLPHGVVYRMRGGANRDWAFIARRMGAAGALLAYAVAMRLADIDPLFAIPVAMVSGLLAALVSIRFEKIPGVR